MKCNWCWTDCSKPFRRGIGNRCAQYFERNFPKAAEFFKTPSTNNKGKRIKAKCKILKCPNCVQSHGLCQMHFNKLIYYNKWIQKRPLCVRCKKQKSVARKLCGGCYSSVKFKGKLNKYPCEKYKEKFLSPKILEYIRQICKLQPIGEDKLREINPSINLHRIKQHLKKFKISYQNTPQGIIISFDANKIYRIKNAIL